MTRLSISVSQKYLQDSNVLAKSHAFSLIAGDDSQPGQENTEVELHKVAGAAASRSHPHD